jgi:hypothetical protein
MLRLIVSQYVLVSSSLWNPWPYIIFCLKVAVLSLWGALSDERSGLSPVNHCQQYLIHCQNVISFTFYMPHMFYLYAIYTRPLSAQAQYSSSHYNGSLDTWTVLRLAASKFKPLLFSVLVFALPYIADKSKSKSHYERQSVGQSVLVSSAHLGPATNFSISLRISFRQLLFVML